MAERLITDDVLRTLAFSETGRKRGKKLAYVNEQGKEICGGKRGKRSKELGFTVYCGSTVLFDNGRCERHGGGARKGLAHPSGCPAGGIYSQDLPTRMLADYQAGRNNPRVLSLTDEISALRARVLDRMRKAEQKGESLELYRRLDSEFREFKTLQALIPSLPKDSPERAEASRRMTAALSEVETLIARGLSDFQAWEAIERSWIRLERLVRSERKAEFEAGQLVKMDRAELLMMALLQAVRNNVTNPDELAGVQKEFARLTEGLDIDRADAA
jgi:hypothetical protein